MTKKKLGSGEARTIRGDKGREKKERIEKVKKGEKRR